MDADTLIDKARARGLSDAAIARAMGLTPGNLCDALAGRRSLPPEAVALLADELGEDAREAAAHQMVRNAKAPKRERLARALFGCWVVGVACLATTDATGKASDLTVYTLSRIAARLAARLRQLTAGFHGARNAAAAPQG